MRGGTDRTVFGESASAAGRSDPAAPGGCTGMRSGEFTGLDRDNVELDKGIISVHPEVGALHEVGGKLFLGPPKTGDSVRHIDLPPFLTDRLRQSLAGHDRPMVFPGARGGFQRRSNFNRRATVGRPPTCAPALIFRRRHAITLHPTQGGSPTVRPSDKWLAATNVHRQ